MNQYGNSSRERLNTVHPELQLVFERVLSHWDHSILCGVRSKEDQQGAFNDGKSKVQWPDSKHNVTEPDQLAMAVDAAPYPIDWSDSVRFVAFGCYVCGVADEMYRQGTISHKLRWGGDWNASDGRELTPQSFNDYPHFELIK